MRHSARDQLAFLDLAIARTQAKLDAQFQEWSDKNAPCCPDCMFGAARRLLREKRDRQVAWRAVLAGRLK